MDPEKRTAHDHRHRTTFTLPSRRSVGSVAEGSRSQVYRSGGRPALVVTPRAQALCSDAFPAQHFGRRAEQYGSVQWGEDDYG
jgi:hypothetical protein